MKIFRLISASLLIFCTLITLLFGYKKIGEEKLKNASNYKGIITVWQIDGFEGGTGSRKQFLLGVAREFEKQNSGVLIMVINHNFTSAQENISNGIYPDIISYSNGLDIKTMLPLSLKRSAGGGKVGQKVYATAWCRGGYVLIKNPDVDEKAQGTILVSKSQNTLPLLAVHLEGMEFDEVEVLSPMDAYTKFLLGKNAYLLGTQRDIVRLSNRGVNFSATPLTSFNDLYQYVSLTCSDAQKSVYARRFIDFLVSDSVQEKLSKINMLSPYIDVGFEIETLKSMQNINNFATISAFYPAQILGEIHSHSMLALKGNKNAVNYIKNLLI